MSIYDRIRKRRDELGMSQQELANKTGYNSRSAINKIELGLRDISQSKIELFAEALQTTPAYLMGWEEEQPSRFSKEELKKYGVLPIKTKKFRMIGEVSCGKPIYCNEDYETYIEASADIKADFCVKATGDSMINARIFDGDIVFIKEQPDVENGEIAAVIIGDEITLKRVYKYETRLELRAENPLYNPMSYESEALETIRILGKAVAFQSNVK